MTPAHATTLFLVLGVVMPAVVHAAPTETYAIVVGYNGGRAGLPELRYADDDAVRFALLLAGLAERPGRVWLLTELDDDTRQSLSRAELTAPVHVPPTRSALLAALAELQRAVVGRPAKGGGRVLYVVYAGHGLRGRILLKPEGAPEAALNGVELRTALAEIARVDPSLQVFLFLDACRSQSLFAERDAELGPDFSAEVQALERRADALRIGVLTAATSGKPAGEVRDLRAGYFSHALASGFSGAADSDGDDVVSFGELAAFVAFNTRRLTGQLPWFDPPGGNLGASAFDHRGHRPRLVIPPGLAGRLLVEARGGPPIFVEAFADGHRPLKLALPPGHYRLRRFTSGRTLVALTDLRPGELVDASRLVWAEIPATARGEEVPEDASTAFSAPFSPDVVSTLAAGYHAGREPSASLRAWPMLAAVGSTAGAAPIVGGLQLGAVLRVRRVLGYSFAGARVAISTSSHRTGDERFTLQRHALLLEAGLRWSPTTRLELAAGAGAGVGGLVRRADGRASGDLFGPLLAAGVGVQLGLGGRWSLLFEARNFVQWIRIEGSREAATGPAVDLGLAWGF